MSDTAFTVTPSDALILRNFRKAGSALIPRLRAEQGISLTPSMLARLQTYFRSSLSRDPTVGELRLIAGLTEAGKSSPRRLAVGELYTDSPAIARVWADMMAAHGELHGVGRVFKDGKPKTAPPCSLEDLTTLSTRYLFAAGQKSPRSLVGWDGRQTRLFTSESLPAAIADGFLPGETVTVEGITYTVARRRGTPTPVASCKSGDLLILLPQASPTAMAALMQHERRNGCSLFCDVKAVAGICLSEALTAMCPAAELYPDRLRTEDDGSTSLLPLLYDLRPVDGEGRADYLIRIRSNDLKATAARLSGHGLTAVIWGKTRKGRDYRIRIRRADRKGFLNVVELPSSFIASLVSAKAMTRYRAEAGDPPVATLPPTIVSTEEGLLLATRRVEIPKSGCGFATAACAVEETTHFLKTQGAPEATLSLVIALEAGDLRDGRILETVAGLYHAAAVLELPTEDIRFTRSPDPHLPPTLTVTAVGRAAAKPPVPQKEEIPTDIPTESPNKTTEKGTSTMSHVFEPLCKNPRTVILDTDIGPDCDDVGALVCLIDYAKKYGFTIAGICNCTSNKAGTGTIDAVCRHCGVETPYLGQWSGAEFMNEAEYHKYNDAVAETFSEAYRNGTLNPVDEVTFYRTLLAKAEDKSVMIITIGMFNDLASLLQSQADDISPLSGMELVRAKVDCLVSMAAILPEGRECNVICDYKASQKVFELWPTPVYLSDFHIGWQIFTGYEHIQDAEAIQANPLVMAYHYYTKEWTHLPLHGMNSSYDLTAIQFAVEGEGEFYSLMDPVDLEFYAAPEKADTPDATRAIPNPNGKFRFMKKLVENPVIGDSLNAILRKYC